MRTAWNASPCKAVRTIFKDVPYCLPTPEAFEELMADLPTDYGDKSANPAMALAGDVAKHGLNCVGVMVDTSKVAGHVQAQRCAYNVVFTGDEVELPGEGEGTEPTIEIRAYDPVTNRYIEFAPGVGGSGLMLIG